MAITISGLKERCFADSPVMVKVVYTDAYPKGALARKVVVRVASSYGGNSRQHTFSMEDAGEGSVCLDVSSAVRSVMYGRDVLAMYDKAIQRLGEKNSSGNWITSTLAEFKDDKATFTVQAYVSYVLDGYYREGLYSAGVYSAGTYVESGACTAYFGGLSELERRYGGGIDPTQDGVIILSNKPLAEESAADGHIYIVPWIRNGIPAIATFLRNIETNSHRFATIAIANGVVRSAYIDTSREYVEFLFVNRYGGLEDASALCLESLAYDIDKKQYSSVPIPSLETVDVSLVSSRAQPHASWDMSSGSVTREWAEWWTGEFLTAERHWMKMTGKLAVSANIPDGTWLPVTVKPKSNDATVYDSTGDDALHVDFTVQVGYEGRV